VSETPYGGSYPPQRSGGASYGQRPYGNQPYENQPYENQPYGNQSSRNQPYGNQPQGQQAQSSYDSYESYDSGYEAGSSDAGDLPLAPIWRRAGARLMDAALTWAAGFAVVFPITLGAIGVKKGGDPWSTPILVTTFIVMSVLPFIYEAVLLTMGGQTLGKRLLGLRVVDVDPAGEPIGMSKAIWRSAINNVVYQLGIFFFLLIGVTVFVYALLGMFIAATGVLVSYLWAIWDQPLHQAVHDRFAGTVVIDDRVEYEEE
jgi:uncharacterized RDD family membrane protein YckC